MTEYDLLLRRIEKVEKLRLTSANNPKTSSWAINYWTDVVNTLQNKLPRARLRDLVCTTIH